MNRQQLDAFAPSPNLWQKIDAGMQQPAFIKSNTSWLKYFAYGASAVAAVAALSALLSGNTTTPSPVAATSAASVPEMPVQSVIAADSTSNPPAEKTAVLTLPAKEEVKVIPENTYEPPAVYMPPTAATPAAPAQPEMPEAPVAPVNYAGKAAAYRDTKTDSLNVDTTFAGITHFELTVSSCDVHVKPSGTALVHFKARISVKERGILIGENKFAVEYEKKDNILKIRIINKSTRHIVLAGSSSVEASVDLALPDGITLGINDKYGDVTIDGIKTKNYNVQASSGDVDIADVSGELKLNASYGDVSLENLKGNIDAHAGSGDLSITGLEGNAVLNSSYGRVILKNISGNIKINSSSGDVKISKMTGDLDIVSKYGNIRLEDYKGTPKLDATSGDITGKNVELLESMTTHSKYGNVDMKFLNSFSDLSFDLSTVYGTISLPGTKTSENPATLQVTKGRIMVKGYTASGDQKYQ